MSADILILPTVRIERSEKPRAYEFMPEDMFASFHILANHHDKEGPPGTAIAIRALTDEIEKYRAEFAKAVVVVNEANRALALAQLKAATLFLAAEKMLPAIAANDLAALQSLADELHAAIKLAKG